MKRKYIHYTEVQLENAFKNAGDKASREIFEVLKNRVLAGEKLTVSEEDCFCTGVRLSRLSQDGKITDYKICQDSTFNYLYFIYAGDLTGGSVYFNAMKQEISISQAQSDLATLSKIATEWEAIVKITNHSDQLLQYVCAETRSWILELNTYHWFYGYGFFRRCNLYDYCQTKILLYSKWLYRVCKQIFEESDSAEFILQLNGFSIELTEFSFVHILFRHFAQTLKPFDFDKSHHTTDINPRLLHRQLKSIFQAIENSHIQVLDAAMMTKNIPVRFKYYNNPYLLYINKRLKQKKGVVGNIEFFRLETFFLLTDKKELERLKTDFKEIKINGLLSIYLLSSAY